MSTVEDDKSSRSKEALKKVIPHKVAVGQSDDDDTLVDVRVNNPRYILDLLLSIINVSVKTVDIVNNLPKLKFNN